MNDDDGIDFQWGSNYIKQSEHVPGVGNKYVKFNPDGSVTHFSPPEYLLKSAIREFEDNISSIVDTTKSTMIIKVKDANVAEEKVADFNTNEWWMRRRMRAEIKGDIVTLIAHDSVLQSTHFPADAEDDGIDFQWGSEYIKESESTDTYGKYWKENDDGSITDFNPPQLRCRNLINDLMQEFIFHVIDDYNIEFYDEKTAKEVEDIIMIDSIENNGLFVCQLDGLIMNIVTSSKVIESIH